MADFLIVQGNSERARRWVERGPEIARALGLGAPCTVLGSGATRVWLWPRRNGSTPWIEEDEGSGPRAITLGSWLGDAPEQGPFAVDDEEAAGFGVLIEWADEQIAIGTDAYGSHQCYLREAQDAFAAAGSALLLAALEDTELDPIGCQELLSTGVVYEQRTLWRDVRRLEPDTVLERPIEGPATRRAAGRAIFPERCDLSGRAAVEEALLALRDLARQSASLAENYGGSIVADLTGGWDSRLLAAALLDLGVSFETTVTGPSDSADVRISQAIADRFGFRHTVLPVPEPPSFAQLTDAALLADGELNPIAYARIQAVHEQLRQHHAISFNGSFGEVARGYWWEILQPGADAKGPIDARAIATKRYAAGAAPLDLWPADTRLDVVEHFTDLVARADADAPDEAPMGLRLDRTYLKLRMRSWQGRIASTTDRIWPCLSPLISPFAISTLMRVNPADRSHDKLVRRILPELSPKLAAMPLENGGPAVPITALNLWRFAPMGLQLGKRVVRKLSGGGYVSSNAESTDAARTKLWAEAEFAERFAGDWALGSTLDSEALADFAERSRGEGFDEELLFGRLLGLEIAEQKRRELTSS